MLTRARMPSLPASPPLTRDSTSSAPLSAARSLRERPDASEPYVIPPSARQPASCSGGVSGLAWSVVTIASITPLIGLLGTVVGMIQVFAVIVSAEGAEQTAELAGGISQALVTTAAGLTVAIPALMFHRYFQRRVEDITVRMEEQAGQVVEFLAHHGSELTLAERRDLRGARP